MIEKIKIPKYNDWKALMDLLVDIENLQFRNGSVNNSPTISMSTKFCEIEVRRRDTNGVSFCVYFSDSSFYEIIYNTATSFVEWYNKHEDKHGGSAEIFKKEYSTLRYWYSDENKYGTNI